MRVLVQRAILFRARFKIRRLKNKRAGRLRAKSKGNSQAVDLAFLSSNTIMLISSRIGIRGEQG